MERLENYVEDSVNRLKRIEQDISQGRTRREECRMKGAELTDELKGLYKDLKEAEGNLRLAELQRQENRLTQKIEMK